MEHQIRISPKGVWHRRLFENGHTACGLVVAIYAFRDFTLDDGLCPDCFTSFERKVAEQRMNEELSEEFERAELDRFERESTHPGIQWPWPLPDPDEEH